jgi:putative redox protein
MFEQIVKVSLEENFKTTATARQHVWHGDLGASSGGTDQAPNPEELVMSALGSCMLQTAKLYVARKGWNVTRLEVNLAFERFKADEYPDYEGDALFVHEIREAITIEGDLTDDQKSRIIEIMGKCPIRRLIQSPAFFKEF